MKNIFKLQLLVISMLLSGCMDAAVRFWNNAGWELSPQEKNVAYACDDEYRKTHPHSNYFTHEEEQKYLSNLLVYRNQCVKNKVRVLNEFR